MKPNWDIEHSLEHFYKNTIKNNENFNLTRLLVIPCENIVTPLLLFRNIG